MTTPTINSSTSCEQLQIVQPHDCGVRDYRQMRTIYTKKSRKTATKRVGGVNIHFRVNHPTTDSDRCAAPFWLAAGYLRRSGSSLLVAHACSSYPDVYRSVPILRGVVEGYSECYQLGFILHQFMHPKGPGRRKDLEARRHAP